MPADVSEQRGVNKPDWKLNGDVDVREIKTIGLMPMVQTELPTGVSAPTPGDLLIWLQRRGD
jgi:hypothetical protein